MSTETHKWKRRKAGIYRRDDGVEAVYHWDNRTWFVFLPDSDDTRDDAEPVFGERFATLRDAKEAADARL